VSRVSQDAPFLKACRGEPTSVTPIWLMRQAGRYMKEYRDLRAKVSFLELCHSPELAAAVTIQAVEKLGVDAAIIFADILLILEPLGFQVTFEKGEGPQIHNPVRSAADLSRIRAYEKGGLEYVSSAVRLARAGLPANVPLIGFSGAPFTLASYAIEGGSSKEHALTKAFMHREPEAFRELLAILARAVNVYLREQIEAGADAVQLFDSWAGALAPRDYRAHVLPHSKASLAGMSVPSIHFGTGTGAFIEAFAEVGDVTGLDFKIELDEGWRRVGHDRPIMGNLDPTVLLAGREPIFREADRILEQAAGRKGHIFNLGHGILPSTPVDDVIALVAHVHEKTRR
jgi:uroporphyrinogen decarboxylase